MDVHKQLVHPNATPDDVVDGEVVGGAGHGQLAHYVPQAGMDLAGPRGAADGMNLVRIAHQALRGRYLIAICLGLLTGGLFAALGWRMAKPVYQSEGLIRIAYSLPVVSEETDQNQPLGNMFEPFMLSQRLLIASHRVVNKAVQDPVWKESGVAAPANPQEYFADHMKVEVRPRSEYIQVIVNDEDPGTAATAVKAVINAYEELYKDQERQVEKLRIGALEDRQKALQVQVTSLGEQLRLAAQEYGSTTLDSFYTAATQNLTRLETALAEVRLALAAAGAAPAGPAAAAATQPAVAGANAAPGAATAPAAPRPELTAEQVAATDQLMRTYLDQRDRLESELNELITVNHLGENHKEVIGKKLALEKAIARVERHLQTARELQAAREMQQAAVPPVAAAPNPGGAAPAGPVVRTVEQLRAQEASLAKLYAEAKQENVALGNKRLELQRLDGELLQRREELTKLNRRIEVLRSERSIGGRLNVVSSGGIPLAPQRDQRMKFAGAGGLAGACLPVGLILLTSFISRRYRYSDDTESDIANTAPLLGILPELKKSGSDSEQRAAAAHSVHQIRVSLQAQAGLARGAGSRAYLVTSATAGEGKTTLSTSLALSFSGARLRTLVIDGDIVGRHLTSAMGAQDLEGLAEALATGTVRGRVRKTASGLYVMTAGKAKGPDASAFSAGGVRPLLEECRKHFQVILIDSGPILGSLEAAVLAQEVDGVILTISRGQQRGPVQKAVQRVRSLGGLVVGFVFNRAKPQDFHRSAYATHVSQPAGGGEGDLAREREPAWDVTGLQGFGPVVQAVVSTAPAHEPAAPSGAGDAAAAPEVAK